MTISHYPDVSFRADERPAMTLGNFDGVHLGHQRAIDLLKARARALGESAIAVTFEPHPVSVVRPEQAPKRILTPALKEELLTAAGLDAVVVIDFTPEFSRIEAEDFVRTILVGHLHVSELVLGANFRFGHGRAGDLDALRDFGERFDFVVHEVEASTYEGEIISSSRIRRKLGEGDVEAAAAMLGRPYLFDGTVVRGDGRGKQMGFPTANIEVEGDVLVDDGVYVTEARLGGSSDRLVRGMTHVGRRPTFGLEERTVETHLFDFDEDLYDAPLRLFFHHRIRGTVRFSSAEALEAQLEHDRDEARAYFGTAGRNLVL